MGIFHAIGVFWREIIAILQGRCSICDLKVTGDDYYVSMDGSFVCYKCMDKIMDDNINEVPE